MGKFLDWVRDSFSADAMRRQRIAGEIEDAGNLLVDEATPHYVATVMEAVASKGLRQIERDTRLCEKKPMLLKAYRAALDRARELQEAYKEMREIEAAGEEEIKIEEELEEYACLDDSEIDAEDGI
jgi:hypothetical protein